MSDDRDYWRRLDDMREERHRDYLRDEYRREDENRSDWEREDRRYEERRRDDNHRQAMEEIRRGNTAWALNHIAGPDAAIDYLRAMQAASDVTRIERETHSNGDGDGDGDGDGRSWTPPHTFVTTIGEFLANVSSAPLGVALTAVRIDGDGDAVVEATSDWVSGQPLVARVLGMDSPPPRGHFYVRAGLVAEIGAVLATLRRAGALAADIEELADDT